MKLLLHSSLFLILLLGLVSSRPSMQRLLINNHIWEVPNEPGWEDVIQDAEPVRHLLHKCKTSAECRHIVQRLRDIFQQHSVSRDYLQRNTDDTNDIINSIFKWG
jgi:hypothetical protein